MHWRYGAMAPCRRAAMAKYWLFFFERNKWGGANERIMQCATRHSPGGVWVLQECDDAEECIRESIEWAEICDEMDTFCEIRHWVETPPEEIREAMEKGQTIRQEDRWGH